MALSLCLLTTPGRAQKPHFDTGTPGKPAIVSPTYPKDSQGETVYEVQGESQIDQPVIPGALIPPVMLKAPKPKYSKALKKEHFSGDVTLLAVTTATGEIIDVTTDSSTSEEASACAVAALKEGKMRPATLDGKPIATRLRIVIHFAIR